MIHHMILDTIEYLLDLSLKQNEKDVMTVKLFEIHVMGYVTATSEYIQNGNNKAEQAAKEFTMTVNEFH